jgi:hypothetical protein
LLVFGLIFVSCDDGNGNGNGNNGNGNGYDTNGFTLTNIPSEFNGKYAFFMTEDEIFVGAQSVDMETGVFTLVQISNHRVNLPVWKVIYDNDLDTYSLESFSGNDILYDLFLVITNLPTFAFYGESEEDEENQEDPNQLIVYWYLESVTFANGKVTKSWADGEVIELDEEDNNPDIDE